MYVDSPWCVKWFMFNKKDHIWFYFIKPPLPVKMSPLFSVLCLCESEPVKDANKKSLTALWQVLPAEQEKFHWKESSLISCLSLPQIWLTFKIHLLCFRALLWWKQTFAESQAGMNSDIKTRFHAHKRVLLTGASALAKTHVRLLPDENQLSHAPCPCFHHLK